MRRLAALSPLLALAALLAGCTGTTENVPPLLLAVGQVTTATPAQPQLVLVEDNFSSSQSTTRTLSVVAGSARDLDYPAVASDVVDRAGTRSAMVVLTRQLTASSNPDPASRLVTFNLSGIDPATPTAFDQTAAIQLTGGTSPVFPGSTGMSGPWCFSGVTVSLTGRYVTLLDDPAACGDTSGRYPRLVQLDTSTTPPAVTTVEPAAGSQPVQATVPFDDQADTDESLYFLVAGVNQALVYQDPVPHDASTAPTASVAQLPTQQQTALLGTTPGGGVTPQLVAVTNQDPTAGNTLTSYLQAVDLTDPAAATSVETAPGARTFAFDPAGISQRVVVAGASSLALHATPGDDKPIETTTPYTYTGAAAAIDPINRFGYVVDDGRIVVIDLDTAASAPTSWIPYAFPVAITLPVSAATNLSVTTAAWARSAP